MVLANIYCRIRLDNSIRQTNCRSFREEGKQLWTFVSVCYRRNVCTEPRYLLEPKIRLCTRQIVLLTNKLLDLSYACQQRLALLVQLNVTVRIN
jgi:hypothetical protein